MESIKAMVLADPSCINSAIGEYGESPLMHAISGMDRDWEIIKFLVDSGANVTFCTKEGYTPLHSNIDLNGPSGSGELPYQIARLLKERGADTEARNHYGWTPLMRAALEGTTDEFKALLDIGARYDVQYTEYSMPVFTRGRSLAEISMPWAEKFALLLKFGLKPDSALLAAGMNSLAKVKGPESEYSKNVRASVGMIKKALNVS